MESWAFGKLLSNLVSSKQNISNGEFTIIFLNFANFKVFQYF